MMMIIVARGGLPKKNGGFTLHLAAKRPLFWPITFQILGKIGGSPSEYLKKEVVHLPNT
jgi:hypothetical protein